jgi:hypothetical protein
MPLERHAGRSNDDADRVLPKPPLIGRNDGVEPGPVVDIAGQHDFDALGRLVHQRAAVAIAPLPDG